MKIFYTEDFFRQLKKLPKHFSGIFDELDAFLQNYELKKSDSIGKDCFKIRFSPADFHGGKSGALRVIVLFHATKNGLVSVAVFAKSDAENISKTQKM